MNFLIYLVLALVFVVLPSCHATGENDLLEKLKGKSAYARPVLNVSNPVMVTFGFELVHIVKVSESEQTVTQKLWLRMSWLNELMTWEPGSWDGITTLRLDPASVWKPDLFLQEDVSSDMALGPEKYKTQVVMKPNGLHTWYVPVLFQSSCTFHVDKFPFDKQSCTLHFTPWTHTQNEVDLIIDTKPVVTSNYINSSEWEIISTERERRSIKYACCPNPFVDIKYTINLRRKPLYYVYSVITPCIIQMVIILFTFFLPPDSGERIGVVITVLLVFAVYLEVLSSFLPKTSTATPALSTFYLTAMAESAASLIATCIVLIIHFKGTEKGVGPMPNWIRYYFIDSLAKVLCVRKNLREHSDDGLLALEHDKGSYKGLNNVGLQDLGDGKGECGEKKPITMETLVEEVRVITALINDQNRQDEIEEEWQILGKVFDRIFFFIFLIIFVVSSSIFLYPMFNTPQ